MKMKMVPLADVYWKAANVHLQHGNGPWVTDADDYTCYSVALACGSDPYQDSWRYVTAMPAIRYLRSIGCATNSTMAFSEFEAGRKRQSIRYMWLLIAMHCAEDEGVMVEVPADWEA